MKKFIFLALAVLVPSVLIAQTFPRWGGGMTGIADSNGDQFGKSNALPVNTVPSASSVTATSVTCGTSSTPFGVTGNTYLSVMLPLGGSNVCFGWGSNAATTSSPSQCFSAGAVLSWGGGTGSCIVSTGTQVITLETK